MRNEKFFLSYETNCWRCEDPAELPPGHWVIANHVLDAIVESLDSVAPGNRDALEEDEEEKTETTDRVRVEDLEHEHPALGDASKSNAVADDANHQDEKFFAFTEELWPLIDHRSNETFHGTELGVETDEKQHKEEQARPKWRTWKLKNG